MIVDYLQFLTDSFIFQVEIELETFQDRVSELHITDLQGVAVKLGPCNAAISAFWDEQPPKEYTHVFVELPAKEGKPKVPIPSIEKSVFCFLLSSIGRLFHLSAHLANVFQARDAPSPSDVVGSIKNYISEQEKRPIYNGRPIERCGTPVVIYDKSLANLKQDLDNLSVVVEPPVDYVHTTAQLFIAASRIYSSESERGTAMYSLLNHLLGIDLDLSVEAFKDESKQKAAQVDAIAQEDIRDETFGKKKAVVVYMGLKNELGSSGDGGLQAALSLRKHITQKAVKSFMVTPNIL